MSADILDIAPVRGLWNARVTCGVTLALVFLCGAVIGAVVMDFGVHGRGQVAAFDTPQGKAAYFERMQKELDLTPAQSEQIGLILNDFWQYYRTVLSDAKQRIDVVLTPEQKVRFERLLQDQKK
jgi:Spy/CpxP family protein refolding chaperone